MAFIRKGKTANGTTTVQIAFKQKGRIVKITPIGSAHNEDGLNILLRLARKQLHINQLALFSDEKSSLHVVIKRSFSNLLWNALREEYDKVGFTRLDDEVFEALCITRNNSNMV